MKLSFSKGAIDLLRFVLSYTGEKITTKNNQGEDIEQENPRRLNNEESSQRRHFFKEIKPITEAKENKLKEAMEAHNAKVKVEEEAFKKDNPKNDGESEKEYQTRVNIAVSQIKSLIDSRNEVMKEVDKLLKEKDDITITDKTLEVLKKYFKQFGDDNGWSSGDDDIVSEIEEQFAK